MIKPIMVRVAFTAIFINPKSKLKLMLKYWLNMYVNKGAKIQITGTHLSIIIILVNIPNK